MSILVAVEPEAHSISVCLAVLLKSIKLVIESLPLVSVIPIVVSLGMSLNGLSADIVQKVKIEADLALDLKTVDQEHKLWLDTGVKEYLKVWMLVAIDLHMGKSTIIGCEVIVVPLYLLADGVPAGVEIQAGISWLLFVKIVNEILNALW